MSWKNIKLIFHREIRDQLRDRRTLFMIAILPLILYPGLAIGMVHLTALFQEQPRTVVLLGTGHLPTSPALLQQGRFADEWFSIPADAQTLNVFTDAPDAQRSADAEVLLELARHIREKYARRAELDAQSEDAEKNNATRPAEDLQRQIKHIDRELSELFADSGIEVLVLVPDQLRESIQEETRRLIERGGIDDGARKQRPVVVYNSADQKSRLAQDRVKEALGKWEKAILKQQLAEARLPESLSTPVDPKPLDLAGSTELSNSTWSMIVPAILVIMTVTGAFYPAVDLAAGEKERGTMETLLICPARRSEIVIGKFLTVLSFSISTALLNLLGMGATGKYIASVAGTHAAERIPGLALPSFLALVWMAVLLLPLATLFSALCLALATFARSSKEGQYYLTPLLTVTLGLTVFCLSPAVEITPFYSIAPVMGPALLLKELIAAPGSTAPLAYAVPVLVSSIAYGLVAIWWAIEQFEREDVLFREAERFELFLWLRHLIRDKGPTPSFAEASLCIVVIMLAQFAAMKFLKDAIEIMAPSTGLLKLQIIHLVATIAFPALVMGVMLASSLRQTFRLYWPDLRMLLAGVVLAVTLFPLTFEVQARLVWFFPQLPPSVAKVLESMSNQDLPLWVVLLTFALAPAVCEELAFRGFMLSGFSHTRRPWVAILLSSVAFGIVHQIPQQVFNASLLGLVLGLLVVRSNSLLPSVLFHLVYNSMQVFASRFAPALFNQWQSSESSVLEWFISLDGNEAKSAVIRYDWPALAIAAALAAALIAWLLRFKRPLAHA